MARFSKGHIPHNKGRGKLITCLVCGKKKYIEDNVLKAGKGKFCSKKCAYKGRVISTLFKKGHKDLVPKDKRGHKQETRDKISKTLLSQNNIGNKCWNWKGGVSKIDKLIRRLKEYFQWRSDCFTRDNWTCQTCGFRGGYVTVHHIKSFHNIIVENNIKDINEARKCKELWDINNGVTLCEECHKLTDSYRGRGKIKKTINI